MHNPALYYFAGVVLVTFVATVLLCRRRVTLKKQSFLLPALANNLAANAVLFALVFLSGRVYAEGWHVFTSKAWESGGTHSLGQSLFDAGLFIGMGTVICIPPVLGVAVYYERRSRK
jgi:hypothetical protein